MHPFVRIVCLISFAIALQLMRWQLLFAADVLLLIGLAWCGAHAFQLLIRRARWLLLSILLIYAYATPGEYLPWIPDAFAPSYEGLQAGLTQMGRLASILAALSILLATSSREDIMIGIYLLLQPFRMLGVSPERFATRLWLTLHYVETMPSGVVSKLRQDGWRLESILQDGEQPNSVQIQFPRFRVYDALVLMLLPSIFWMLP
jgi:energy-coupling factor transport system permease protein